MCEGACVIEQSGHGAVTIGAVERWLTDLAFREGWVEPLARFPAHPGRPRSIENAQVNGLHPSSAETPHATVSESAPVPAPEQSVGIIGAGPAGLAAAERLCELGYRVTIYDRHDRAGGLLWYGIPNFKLEKAIVARRTERLAGGGVAFVLNCEVGRDIALRDLRARHDAVLIATGVYAPRALGVAGVERAVPALDYLNAATRAALGDSELPAALDAGSRRVVVIGGGDTAMDCVRTAVRQGAQSVTCLYRRDRANMPGSAREVVCAEEEGVRFRWLAEPTAIGPEGVRAARMVLRPKAGG
ncbi:MAG: FAD-dependent oxidoreductase, partial [Hyphomonadaceae bacterium]|nr:FAD-dependent oxidoreductase [Hyphomonadaceae bacterium]